MARLQTFNPSQELRLGACKMDNLMYRLKDDPSMTRRGTESGEAAKLIGPEEQTALRKENYGYSFMRETVIFFVFLGLFVFAAVITVPEWSYDSVELMRKLLVTPENGAASIKTPGDFFTWLRGTCIPTLFKDEDSTGEPLDAYDSLFVRQGNRLMGPVRVRQVRINDDCSVGSVGSSLAVGACLHSLYGVTSSEETKPYGFEYLVNGVSGYSKQEVDSLRAQGYGANITYTETRWQHNTASELCSEEPNPDRDIGSTVDSMARAVQGSNEGLQWYCEVGMQPMGKLGISYPNSGFVLDLPPVSWFAAWNEYQTEKLVLTKEWNERFGPKVQVERSSRTETVEETETVTITPTVVPAVANYTATEIFINETATREVPTETTPIVPTVTPVDTALDLPSIPSKLQYSMGAVDELVDYRWIDNHTAMVTVEFTLYNANTNMLVASRLIFEFLPTGQVIPYYSIKPLLLPDVESFRGVLVFLTELMLVGFITYYAMKEVVKARAFFMTNWRHCQVCTLKKMKAEYLAEVIVCTNCQRPFNPFALPYCPDCYYDVMTSHTCWKGYFSMWNIIDLLNIAIFLAVFGLRFKLRSDVDKIVLRTETQFIQFYPLAWQFGMINCLNSANVMLSFFKTIKYLGKVRALSVLVKTLVIAMGPVFWFLIFFGVVYVGFAISFLLAFGKDVEKYRSLGSSYMSLFVMILGRFDYAVLELSNYVLAPVLFLVYNIFIVLILSNVFISIVDECYGEASEKVQNGRIDYLNSSLRVIFNKLKKKWLKLLGKTNETLDKVVTLIKNISVVKQLEVHQKDDMRAFLKTLIDENDEEMALELLRVFHGDVTRVMRYDDYQMLLVTTSDMKAKRANRNKGGKSFTFVDRWSEEAPGVDLSALREEAEQRRQTRRRSRKESVHTAHQMKNMERDLEAITAKMELLRQQHGSVPGWNEPKGNNNMYLSGD